MKNKFILSGFSLFFLFCAVYGETFRQNGVEFVYRKPKNTGSRTGILVLFGGRDWNGFRTLTTFGFEKLADEQNLFLLSPSFSGTDYWEPEKGSGPLLFQAIEKLEKMYRIPKRKVLFYGYSAGGQCTALFLNYAADRVEAWALHASGVYPPAFSETLRGSLPPGMITCGEFDEDRIRISTRFLHAYRNSGGSVLWLPFRNQGHELSPDALRAAEMFFRSILRKQGIVRIGEDATMQEARPGTPSAERIAVEYRNEFRSTDLFKMWKTTE